MSSRVLLVRKRGTLTFMQPGGKRDAGEDDIAALAREIERNSVAPVHDFAPASGQFDATSANEPGFRVHAALYAIDVTGEIAPKPRSRRRCGSTRRRLLTSRWRR